MRNLRDGAKWIPGTIIERTGPVSYRVQVSDQVWRRHTDILLEHSVSSQSESVPETEMLLPDTSLPQIPQVCNPLMSLCRVQLIDSRMCQKVWINRQPSPRDYRSNRNNIHIETDVRIDCHTSFS